MTKQLQIRNSTAEFLIFQAEDKAQGVQVFYQDENIWATQKTMAELYGVDRSVVTKHLKNIFESLELQQDAVSAIFAHTALDGKTDAYLNSDERPLLTHAGSVSHEAAQEYAETEFEKYRIIQDRLFESDFDRFVLPTLPFDGENKD